MTSGLKLNIYRKLSQIITLETAGQKDGRKLVPSDLSIIEDATIVFDENKILWVGKDEQLPVEYLTFNNKVLKFLPGYVLTPEIVDSHTHLVFGGDRSNEYVSRLNGATYEEIALAGGGIKSTMNATQKLNKIQLFELAKIRINTMINLGAGTIEVKSGYGLNFEKELELSQIISELKTFFSPKIQIFRTFMAAHAIGPSFTSSQKYMKDVVIPLLFEVTNQRLVDAVDIFHENGYFNTSDVEELFKVAQKLNIPCKIHADEFNDNGGALLADKYQALSCDHLLNIGYSGIQSLANSNTVATLLPGTGFFLGKPSAPARKLLDAGVKVALASDYNPGSCHCDNLILLAQLAASQLNFNIAEIWSAITLNAAHALGFRDQGMITPQMKPRFSLFKVNTHDEILYHWGKNFAINASEDNFDSL